ncbi:LysR substrate-binding domain-containing protein [Psychrobacter pygoscelis]|uniref:LysR substrate-binding domain-containing protein n=1 Tax=Psychrobacter pygoscelis TaxID=2488563 RepID=UPI00103F2E46|nr:LysR substrate-binding domain-containing protein [Psychrobacter pygoscelis]
MSLPKMTLKQLAIFVSVFETGSTSGASEVLHLSQSAVSSALTQLESRLNMPLFERVGRRLEVHPYAEQLYAQAQAILSQVHSLEQYHEHQAGQIRIGASTTIGNYVLPSIIAKLSAAQQGADIDVHIANTREVIAEVEQLRVDIALVEATPHPSNVKVLTQQIWRTDKLVVFAKRDSRWLSPFAADLAAVTTKPQGPLIQGEDNLRMGYSLSTEQLAGLPFIVREAGSGTRQIIDEKLLQHLPGVRVTMEIAQSEAIKRMVSADIGVGCLSQHVIESELASGELVQITVDGLDLSRQWWLVWHNSCHQSRLWQQFIQMIAT